MAKDFKPQIIALLEQVRQKEFSENQKFKVIAYNRVLKQLKDRKEPIHTIEDVKGIKGIGVKIHDKIEEIITTGDLGQVHDYGDAVNAVADLSRVFGIGPVRARELYTKHNIKTVDDLKIHEDLLNDKQKMGLKYYEHFEKRIPRAEMDKHATIIFDTIREIDPKLKVEIMGSYRRGLKDSGDIDVLIAHEDDPEDYPDIFKSIVDALTKPGYLTDTFAFGSKKYNGVCKLKRHRTYRRIDIMYSRLNTFPFALLYFTGSANFNVAMRNHALEKGLSLNEYGLTYMTGNKKGEHVQQDFRSEEDVFDYLGLQFVAPQERKEKVSLKHV